MTDERSFNKTELQDAFELLRQNFFQRVDYGKNSATPDFNANPASEQKTSESSTPGVKEPPKTTPSASETQQSTKQPTSPKETQQAQPAAQETQLGGKQPEKIRDGFVYRYDPDFVCFGKQGWYVAYRYQNGVVTPFVLKESKDGTEITYPAFSWKTTNPNAGKVETIDDVKKDDKTTEKEETRQTEPALSTPQTSPDEPTPGIVKILDTIKAAGEESYSKVKGVYDPQRGWVTWNQNPNEFASAKNEWVANNFLEGFSTLAKEIARMRRAGRSSDDITELMRTAVTNATEILRTAHGSEGGYEALSKYSQVLGTDLTKAKRAVEIRNAVARRVNDLGRMSVKELEEYAEKAHATFFANRNAARNPWILEEQAAANKEFGSVDHFVDATQNFSENDYEAIKNAVSNNETLSSSPVLAGVKTALTQALESEGIRSTDEKRSFLDTDGSRDYFNDELTALYDSEQLEASLLAKPSEVKGTEVYRKFIDAARSAKERRREKLAKAIGRAAVAWRDRLGVVDETTASRTTVLPEPVPPSTPLYDRAYLNNGYSFATLDELSVDPARFQFKQDVNKATGAGAALQGVKTFNPELSSVLLVWHDPSDNRDYVVNGHHRFDLARRAEKSGQPKITLGVQFINAKDAKEAKTVGALANLSEQHASVIDAAVFLRHNAHDEESLLKIGLPKDQGLIKEAKSLANLSNAVFNRLEAAGEDAVPGANAISEILGLPTSTGTFHSDEERRIFERDRTNAEELQKQTWDFLASKDKLDDYDFAIEAAREFRDAESKSMGFDLFGNEINESTATDKIEAKARIAKELKNRVRAHHLGRAGKSYAREGGVEEAAQKEAEAQKVLTEYLTSRLNARDDAINSVVRKASDEYAKAETGEERKRIIQTAGDDIERIVAGGNKELLGGSQTAETSGSVATDNANGRENSDGENKPSSNVDDGAPSLLEEPKEEKKEQVQEPQTAKSDDTAPSLFDVKEAGKEEQNASSNSASPSLFDVAPQNEEEIKKAEEELRKTAPKEQTPERASESVKTEAETQESTEAPSDGFLFPQPQKETKESPLESKKTESSASSSEAEEALRTTQPKEETQESEPSQTKPLETDGDKTTDKESAQPKNADEPKTLRNSQPIREFFSVRPNFFEYIHDSGYFKEQAKNKEWGKKGYSYRDVIYELNGMLQDLHLNVGLAYTYDYLESTGILKKIESLQNEVSKISSLKKLEETRKKIAAFFDENFAQEKQSLLNDDKTKTDELLHDDNGNGKTQESAPLFENEKEETDLNIKTTAAKETSELSQTSDATNQDEKTKRQSPEEALRQTAIEEDKARINEKLAKASEELRTIETPKKGKAPEKQEVYNDAPAFSFATPSFAENATSQAAAVRRHDADSLKKEFQQSQKEKKTESTPPVVEQKPQPTENKPPQTEAVAKPESEKKKRNKANRSLKNRDEQEGDAADLWLKQMEASLSNGKKETTVASNATPQAESQTIKQSEPKSEPNATKKPSLSKKTQSQKTSRKISDVLECIETGDLNGLPEFKDASKGRVKYAADFREWAINYTLSPYKKPSVERKSRWTSEIKSAFGDDADAEALLREVVAKRVAENDDVNWWIEHKTEIEKGLLAENPVKAIQEIQRSGESLQDEYSRRVRAFNEKLKEKNLSKEEREALSKEEEWLWETRKKLRPASVNEALNKERGSATTAETRFNDLENIEDVIKANEKSEKDELEKDVEETQKQEKLNKLLETLRETNPKERAEIVKQFLEDKEGEDKPKDDNKEEFNEKKKEPKPRYSSKDDAGKIDFGMLPKQVVEAIISKYGTLEKGIEFLSTFESDTHRQWREKKTSQSTQEEQEKKKREPPINQFVRWYATAKNTSFQDQKLTTEKGAWGAAEGYASFLEKRSGHDLYDYGRKEDVEQAIKEAQERKNKKTEDANAKQEEALEWLRKSGNVSEDQLDALRLTKKSGDKLTDEEKQKISMNNPSYNERIVQSIKKGDSTQALRHSIAFMQEITKANKDLYDDVLYEVDPDFESDDPAKADGSLRGRIQKAIMRASNKKAFLDEFLREEAAAQKQGTERRQSLAEKELAKHVKKEQKNKAHASIIAQDKQGIAVFAKQEESIDEVDRLHRELIRRVRDAVHNYQKVGKDGKIQRNPAQEVKEERIKQIIAAVHAPNAEPKKEEEASKNKKTSKQKNKETPSATLFDKEKYSLEEAREFLRLMC